MEGFNKIISFVLGLVVVIVFFAVVTKKIDLKNLGKTNKNTTATTKSVVSPTPVSSIKIDENPQVNINNSNSYKTIGKTTSPKSIPSTGLPTIFIPLLFSGVIGGSLLKKTGKKS